MVVLPVPVFVRHLVAVAWLWADKCKGDNAMHACWSSTASDAKVKAKIAAAVGLQFKQATF